MSTQIKGTAVRRIAGAMVTDDGSNVLLRFEPVAGPEIILAMPTSQLNHLILAAAQSASGARAKRGVDPNLKEAFIVEEWALDMEPEDRVLVLSFTLPGSAELSFRLPLDVQQPLIDKLAATVAPPAADPSQLN